MTGKLLTLLLYLIAAHLPSPSFGRTSDAPSADYLTADFDVEHILDWGTRPVWSPDGKRIVFLRDDHRAGPAYELNLTTRRVRCLTCRWGIAGHVSRIYYLPDGSFLTVGNPLPAMGHVPANSDSEPVSDHTELYWMPADASQPPKALGAHAFGEVAVDYDHDVPGEARIAWGEFFPRIRMMLGRIIHDGKRASLTGRKELYRAEPANRSNLVTLAETYDFVDDGNSVMFWTIERGKAYNGMYKVDIASGRMTPLVNDGQHSEIHAFPDVRFGLEESNRASDPSSPYRGVSGHAPAAMAFMLEQAGLQAEAKAAAERYGGKSFDLYVVQMDTGKRRRLTYISDAGGRADQSSPARDGKRVAFALRAPNTGPFAGKGGLYIGTFSNSADTVPGP